MKKGFTLHELLVTVLIAAILATTVGVFLVKLLTLQEKDREEGYIREALADICAYYADFASIGSSFSVSADPNESIITYRNETGGVSLETGRVSRVAYLTMTTNSTGNAIALNAYAYDNSDQVGTIKIFSELKTGLTSGLSQTLRGDPLFISSPRRKLDLNKIRISSSITPLKTSSSDVLTPSKDESFNNSGFYKSDAVLGGWK